MGHRAVLQFLFGAFFYFVWSLSGAWAQAGEQCGFIKGAFAEASRLRSLKIKSPVKCLVQNKEDVKDYLIKTVKTKIPAERIKGEESMYQLLGLIPVDYDYLNGLIELYTSQLGGYYDPSRKFYAMASWMPELIQYPIAVHELTHALQDQHFKLERLVDDYSLSSDTQLSYSALFEGDAMIVMLNHTMESSGKPLLQQQKDISSIIFQNVIGASFALGATKSPDALELVMLFPYSGGMNFVHTLLREGGYDLVNNAFKRLPATTEEILHPQKYLSNKKDYEVIKHPTSVPMQNILATKNSKIVYSDTMGEFLISTLLASMIGPAQGTKAAAGWGGDRAFLYRLAKGDLVLHWETLWDTSEDAREFLQAWQMGQRKRLNLPQDACSAEQTQNGECSKDLAAEEPLRSVIQDKQIEVHHEIKDKSVVIGIRLTRNSPVGDLPDVSKSSSRGPSVNHQSQEVIL